MYLYRVRVYFEDTDCGQIVYHTNYLKYCERARSEMFFAQNLQPFDKSCGFVLKHIEADFIASARLGDKLEVRSEANECKNASITLTQSIYRIYNATSNQASQELVFRAYIKLAFVDVAHSRPVKIPSYMRDALSPLLESK